MFWWKRKVSTCRLLGMVVGEEVVTCVAVTWEATLSSVMELNLSDEARVVVTQVDLPGAEFTRLESRDVSESE